ncbi:hypothetical protein PSAC2689_240058 [Paraburkholderia sacchari]
MLQRAAMHACGVRVALRGIAADPIGSPGNLAFSLRRFVRAAHAARNSGRFSQLQQANATKLVVAPPIRPWRIARGYYTTGSLKRDLKGRREQAAMARFARVQTACSSRLFQC